MISTFSRYQRLLFWGLGVILLPLAGCGADKDEEKASSTGNASVMVKMSPAAAGAALTAVSDAKLCFKRLRFKLADEVTADPATNSDNIDFNIGEKTLGSADTDLGTISLAPNTYKRVEFDLEKDCNGYSVKFTNANGTFMTDQRLTIKFKGVFTVDEATETVKLGIAAVMTALDGIPSGAGDKEIKEALDNVSGTF